MGTQKRSTTKVRRCTCSGVFRHMCDTLGADMDSPRCRAMRAHVSECANCQAYLDSLKKTVALYASYPAPSLPARVKNDLLRSLKHSALRHKRTGGAHRNNA